MNQITLHQTRVNALKLTDTIKRVAESIPHPMNIHGIEVGPFTQYKIQELIQL